MEEEKKHIDELIATYLTEGLDKNALAELKTWIAASPENKNYFIQRREVWFSAVSREAALKYNKDKAFDTFKKRIGNRKEIEKTSHHGFRLSMLWRYAAIIAVVLAVGCFSYWQGHIRGYIRRSSFRIEDKALFAGRYIGLAECRFTNDLLTRFRSR